MKLIVGLGNPGKQYENTRHNIGFDVIDTYLNSKGEKNYKDKFQGLYHEININNEKIIFLKPQKYMNLSGEVIKKYIDFFKISINDILVIQDDLDQKLGKIKLKQNSSSGGHNGIKNIELNLGTKNYKRLKIGISNDKNRDTKDYVLEKMNSDERQKINETIKECSNIIEDYLKMDFDSLMNKYN